MTDALGIDVGEDSGESFGPDLGPDFGADFGGIGALLRGFADNGDGTIVGLVPRGRAGVRRVSRTQAAEFDQRLAQAYRERLPSLIRHAARKVGDHGRAEDVVQRAFEKILRRYQENRPEISNIDAYVFTTVCNEINRELRDVIPARRNSSDPADLEAGIGFRSDLSGQVVDAMAVRAALAELAPREREAVIMRLQWQLSVAEAAEVMHLSDGAVKRYTADGVRRLRERLTA
ncbi:RNA polymerase sigma factor [Pseudonocardia sp. GCM10023141]|uniref:RNA polymerase sigma factor n=1 Tax=Pseudonocardia sp. GCM10023141 TaxID=3252653 RepID=UPI00361D9822